MATVASPLPKSKIFFHTQRNRCCKLDRNLPLCKIKNFILPIKIIVVHLHFTFYVSYFMFHILWQN
jgi:hypothetical protein